MPVFFKVSLGDTLVSVDGKDVTGLDDSQLAKLIIGPAGTKVNSSVAASLTIPRDSDNTFCAGKIGIFKRE